MRGIITQDPSMRRRCDDLGSMFHHLVASVILFLLYSNPIVTSFDMVQK